MFEGEPADPTWYLIKNNPEEASWLQPYIYVERNKAAAPAQTPLPTTSKLKPR
jgi:hypothetical protein